MGARGASTLAAELVRDEVAAGRLIIPANTEHLKKKLEPMGIGIAVRCKITANIGIEQPLSRPHHSAIEPASAQA